MQLASVTHATRSRVLSVGLLSLVLSGCVASEEPSGGLAPSVRAQFEELLEEARKMQSSDAQIAALEQALASDKSITFEQYVQAKDAEIACVRDLGFDIVEEQRLDHGSWIEIKYLYGGIPRSDALNALLDEADRCMDVHARFLEYAYQIQPSIEETDAMREERRAEFVACLHAEGVNVDEKADWSELVIADREHARSADEQNCYEQLNLIELG